MSIKDSIILHVEAVVTLKFYLRSNNLSPMDLLKSILFTPNSSTSFSPIISSTGATSLLPKEELLPLKFISFVSSLMTP